ncbi:Photosynthetic apparatus regulatory protein RegA [Ferriphaselus amnicola]|uniref:Photosynthetic apparatus regulatory protein RegA n=1 Tax=Ferriphaselus amnicola TaxID=1188319 RepID=A0A2Z6G9D5_9PROT|nr:response regulator [Ferriphaselus amnicola]BBE50131.1 Photosynthetic apparatus regulatory protein RegA [Ferriphaselus amnicola]
MTMQATTEKVLLLVDNDVSQSRTLAQSLKRQGYSVHHAISAEEALPLILELRPDFGVFNLKLPGASGMVLVDLLHRSKPQSRVVVLTHNSTLPPTLSAIHCGSVQFLAKSSSAEQISATLSGTTSSEPALPLNSQPTNEAEFLHRKLGEHHGNITETARALKMHRRTLQRKLAKIPAA